MTARLYYGWWIVGICMVALSMTAGMSFYSIGVFFNPLMEEFGWNRTRVSAIVTVYWGVTALCGPFVGRFMDVFGPRRTMFFGMLGSTLFLCLLSLTRSLFYFYGVYALVALSHTALAAIPYGYLVSRWFQERRGMAMGIATTGIGLGGVLIAPVSSALIRMFGWRTAYAALGIGVLAVMLPLLAFVREGPESGGRGHKGTPKDAGQSAPPGNGLTAGEALRSPVFWMAAFGLLLAYGTVFGTLSHQVPFIRDMGIPPAGAAAIFGFTAAMGVAGKLVFGYLMDRFPARTVVSSCFLLQALGVLALVFTRGPALLWTFVVVFGFSMGGTATLRPLIVSWLFGLRSYGAIFGATQVFQALGSSLFPLLAGMIFDAAGSYYWALLLFIASATAAAGIFLFLPSPAAGSARLGGNCATPGANPAFMKASGRHAPLQRTDPRRNP